MDIKQIAQESARLLEMYWKEKAMEGKLSDLTQLHVDFFFDKENSFSIEEFTERCLKPATCALAERIPNDVIFKSLELPPNCGAASGECGKVKLRLFRNGRADADLQGIQ